MQQFWHFFPFSFSHLAVIHAALKHANNGTLEHSVPLRFFFTDITGDNAGWKRKGDRAAYTTALSGCRRTKWNIYSRWTRGTVFGEYVETNMSACHVTIVFGASYSTISFTHFLQCHEAPATSRTFFAASFCDILDAFSAVSRCCFFLPCASLKIVSLYLFLLPCP